MTGDLSSPSSRSVLFLNILPKPLTKDLHSNSRGFFVLGFRDPPHQQGWVLQPFLLVDSFFDRVHSPRQQGVVPFERAEICWPRSALSPPLRRFFPRTARRCPLSQFLFLTLSTPAGDNVFLFPAAGSGRSSTGFPFPSYRRALPSI